MKYNLPCEIVEDLLPSYIEKMTSEKTNGAVEEHLNCCDKCKKLKKQMEEEILCEKKSVIATEQAEDVILMKKIKNRLNRKVKIVTIGAVCAVLIVILGFNMLFNIPLKNLNIEDVAVSAEVYATEDLINGNIDGAETYKVEYSETGEEVNISLGENDNGDVYGIVIPDMENTAITITSNAMDNAEKFSVISLTCKYNIKDIRCETVNGILYIESVKTTLLNNKAEGERQTVKQIETQGIEKIVYSPEGGTETVLWQSNEQ